MHFGEDGEVKELHYMQEGYEVEEVFRGGGGVVGVGGVVENVGGIGAGGAAPPQVGAQAELHQGGERVSGEGTGGGCAKVRTRLTFLSLHLMLF